MTSNPLQSSDDPMGSLLRGYFRSRLPVFPPAAVVVGEHSAIAASSRPSLLARSRWAMAVCVALVAFVLGFLASQGQPQHLAPQSDFGGAKANKTNLPKIKPPLTAPKTGTEVK